MPDPTESPSPEAQLLAMEIMFEERKYLSGPKSSELYSKVTDECGVQIDALIGASLAIEAREVGALMDKMEPKVERLLAEVAELRRRLRSAIESFERLRPYAADLQVLTIIGDALAELRKPYPTEAT